MKPRYLIFGVLAMAAVIIGMMVVAKLRAKPSTELEDAAETYRIDGPRKHAYECAERTFKAAQALVAQHGVVAELADNHRTTIPAEHDSFGLKLENAREVESRCQKAYDSELAGLKLAEDPLPLRTKPHYSENIERYRNTANLELATFLDLGTSHRDYNEYHTHWLAKRDSWTLDDALAEWPD